MSDLTAPAGVETRPAAGKAGYGRWLSRGFVAAATAILGVLPLLLNDYQQFVVNTMLVYCLAAVGFNVVLGYLGQLAFANAAFFGIGAYATGLSMVHWGLPFPVAMVIGALAGALGG